MQSPRKRIDKKPDDYLWLVILITVGGFCLAFWPVPNHLTTTTTSSEATYEPETIEEAEVLGLEFESKTTSGVDRETIQLQIERVTVAKPLDQIKFVENPDGQVILMRKERISGTLTEELTQPYTILIPTQRIGIIQSQYQEAFGVEMPLTTQ